MHEATSRGEQADLTGVWTASWTDGHTRRQADKNGSERMCMWRFPRTSQHNSDEFLLSALFFYFSFYANSETKEKMKIY